MFSGFGKRNRTLIAIRLHLSVLMDVFTVMIPSISDAISTRHNTTKTSAVSKTDQYRISNEVVINRSSKVICAVMNLVK